MAITITDAERLTYRDGFMSRVQDAGNVLWPLFPKEPVEGLMKRFDFIGKISSVQTANQRFTPITPVDPLHTNRWLATSPNEQAVFVDKKDIKRVVMDPKSRYMEEITNAFIRKREDVIVAAFDAAVVSGETGTTTTSFDTTNNLIDSAGTYNLTLEKLQDTLFTLETRAFINQMPGVRKYFVWTPAQKRALLRTTEAVNSDYNTVKALVKGEINEFMGFEFITSHALTSADGLAIGSSVNRECYAFTSDAMILGEGMERITDVYERRDLTKYPWQLYALEDIGAMRMQEEKIVKVIVNETV